MTLILSFLLFPKVFSWYYILGASLVLGGLIVVGLKKQYSKLSSNSNSSPNNEMQPLTKESTCDDRDIEIGNDHPSSRS
jgi:hypothetical protein